MTFFLKFMDDFTIKQSINIRFWIDSPFLKNAIISSILSVMKVSKNKNRTHVYFWQRTFLGKTFCKTLRYITYFQNPVIYLKLEFSRRKTASWKDIYRDILKEYIDSAKHKAIFYFKHSLGLGFLRTGTHASSLLSMFSSFIWFFTGARVSFFRLTTAEFFCICCWKASWLCSFSCCPIGDASDVGLKIDSSLNGFS